MWRCLTLKNKNKKAFLLLEVLLTITILAAGLTLLVRSFLTSLQAGKLSSDYIQAQLLLENNLSNFEIQGEVDDSLNLEETLKAPNEKFKFKLTTHNVNLNNQPGPFNSVNAYIAWTAQGKNKSISVSTYLIATQKSPD